jgi:hypothetical protein
VVSIPAEAEHGDILGRAPGEMLWDNDPSYAYGDVLRAAKTAQEPRVWNALYQQNPTPDSGDYFKREWIKLVDVLPPRAEMRVYGGSDYAVTADGTAPILWSKHHSRGEILLLLLDRR